MSDSSVHLVLPGLLSSCVSPEALPDNAAPLWRRTFGAAARGADRRLNASLDVAGLSYLADRGRLPARSCWRCDPVYLQSDLSRVFLFDTVQHDLDDGEAAELIDAFNAQFSDDGLNLECAVAQRWYLFGLPPVEHPPFPLTASIGRDMQALFPRDAHLARLLTEVQMLFHSLPLNGRRESAGRLPVNGVWVHGRGVLPAEGEVPWTGIYSDSVSDRGLARYAGIPVASPPERLEAIAMHPEPGGAVLVRSEELLRAGVDGHRSWLDALEDLEGRWLQPLWRALRSRRLNELVIDDDEGMQFRIGRRQVRTPWRNLFRRDRPLRDWVNEVKS